MHFVDVYTLNVNIEAPYFQYLFFLVELNPGA